MKRKTNKRKHLVLLLVLSMLMANILCACGSSNEVAVTSTKEETTPVKEETQPEVVETEEAVPAEESEAVEETETEVEEIENPEPVEYEGIDLNSTLPAYEWVEQSFPGVINDFKLVIYNDETNYKVIAEPGQKIRFHRDDRLLVYTPNQYGNYGTVDYFIEEGDIFSPDNESYVLDSFYELDDDTWEEGEMDVSYTVIKPNSEKEDVDITLVFVD